MCLIIHNPKALDIPLDVLESCCWTNPDGFGIFYHDTGETRRTMDYDIARELCAKHKGRPFTAHFRYATSGKVNPKSCHPFRIDDRYSLMMNGTIARLVSKKQVDTVALCRLLKGMTLDQMRGVLGTYDCRFALLDREQGHAHIINRDLWYERGGILYSKSNCFHDPNPPTWGGKSKATKDKDYWVTDQFDDLDDGWDSYDRMRPLSKGKGKGVDKIATPEDAGDPVKDKSIVMAVYGTLKGGRGNHRLLQYCDYLGPAVTNDRMPMCGSGIPFLLDRPGDRDGHYVQVELYRVPVSELPRIDGLEGHPNFYRRDVRAFRKPDGSVILAWVYLIPRERVGDYDTGVYIDRF
jgi:gamma-glutamylaminecyclotransferase